MSPDDARAFLRVNHHAVLVTRNPDDTLQSSPVLVGVDDDGHAVVSTTAKSRKARNTEHDPRATLCVFTDDFFGPWVQVTGAAHLHKLPNAMDLLVDLYRQIRGEHPDWDEFRRAMVAEDRVAVCVSIDTCGPK